MVWQGLFQSFLAILSLDTDERAPFNDVEITIPTDLPSVTSKVQLGPSRSYTLSLSPQLLYAQSTLLPALVTSRVHEQLEFLAVGSWWICRDGSSTRPDPSDTAHAGGSREQRKQILQKIPSGREDVFSDNTISARDKRAIMKFLRQVLQEDTDAEVFPPQEFGANSLANVLSSQFSIPSALQQPLLALSLSQDTVDSTNAQYAMNRIRRHLHSIGMFGPGFGAMMIKYGGGAEIAQAGCRAGAVGGGVYVLGRGIDTIEALSVSDIAADSDATGGHELSIKLSDGEVITSRYVVGDEMGLPTIPTRQPPIGSTIGTGRLARSMSVISSPLEHLFPPTSENGPIPAGAVVVFGSEGSRNNDDSVERDIRSSEESPIYLVVHSSDSGECPTGQCESLPLSSWPLTICRSYDEPTYEYLSTLPELLALLITIL
jgi:Rab proteins geranylgeranyltransferase component A